MTHHDLPATFLTERFTNADGDEDMVIGGLLHDAAEDHGGEARLHDIGTRYGTAVEGYVRACSDYLGDDPSPKPPWRPRKEAYLARLRNESVATVTVSMADKVHNARSIITDLHNGLWVFDKFKAAPDDTIWYYASCLEIAQAKSVSPALVTPLERAVQGMSDEVAAWPERESASASPLSEARQGKV